MLRRAMSGAYGKKPFRADGVAVDVASLSDTMNCYVVESVTIGGLEISHAMVCEVIAVESNHVGARNKRYRRLA